MVRLVVFDLDGTLVDSRQDLANAVNALLQERGAPPLPVEVVTGMVGEGAGLLVRRALIVSGLSPDSPGALERFLALYDARALDNTRAYDGIPEVVDQLANRARLAVLTNKPANATKEILAGLSLAPYFGDVIGGDSPHGRKPDPAALLYLAAATSAAPDEVVMVGDSRIDLETARHAGTRLCLARYGFGFGIADDLLRDDDLLADTPPDIFRLLEPFLSK